MFCVSDECSLTSLLVDSVTGSRNEEPKLEYTDKDVLFRVATSPQNYIRNIVKQKVIML